MKLKICFSFIALLMTASEFIQEPEGVKIGTQVWMNQNLGVTAFQNGDPLKYCWNEKEWIKAIEEERPAYTYYNFDPKNGVSHGCIYNYYVFADKRPLPPEGWRVPRYKDLKELKNLAPNMAYFLRSKGNLKDGTGLWANRNFALREYQDKLGFQAIPSGHLMVIESSKMVQFLGMGSEVSWWTESKGQNTKKLQQFWTLRQVFGGMELEIGRSSPKYSGHYVRCIKKD